MVSVQISVVHQMAMLFYLQNLNCLIASKISFTYEISLVNTIGFVGVQLEQVISVFLEISTQSVKTSMLWTFNSLTKAAYMCQVLHAYFSFRSTKALSAFCWCVQKISNGLCFEEEWTILQTAQFVFHLAPPWVMSIPENSGIPRNIHYTPQIFPMGSLHAAAPFWRDTLIY